MLREYFDAGGPVMYVVFAAWVLVFAGVLDRAVYAIGRMFRRPDGRIVALAVQGETGAARARLQAERDRAERGLPRIEAISQVATSIGLFGTVLGIAQSFFARGEDLALAAPEVLSQGLSTALFTTLAGLVVFLSGQVFLIGYREWLGFCEREVTELLEQAEARA